MEYLTKHMDFRSQLLNILAFTSNIDCYVDSSTALHDYCNYPPLHAVRDGGYSFTLRLYVCVCMCICPLHNFANI